MSEHYIERYWRDATPADAIKEPPMVARFRDKDEGSWHFDVLNGWNRRSLAKWLCGCLSWRFCQVYDAPDPGEGWRLIDTDKDSYMQDGIEYREVWQSQWSKRDDLSWMPFSPKTFYRIRITPAVKYVPYTWEDREELRGRWYRQKGDNSEFMVCYITRHNESEICIGPWRAYEFLDGFEWLDGTPCGKVVE